MLFFCLNKQDQLGLRERERENGLLIRIWVVLTVLLNVGKIKSAILQSDYDHIYGNVSKFNVKFENNNIMNKKETKKFKYQLVR